jgi:hypothetical protein
VPCAPVAPVAPVGPYNWRGQDGYGGFEYEQENEYDVYGGFDILLYYKYFINKILT